LDKRLIEFLKAVAGILAHSNTAFAMTRDNTNFGERDRFMRWCGEGSVNNAVYGEEADLKGVYRAVGF